MLSNWEKRPLSKEQVEWAALDAYCLLDIMKGLKKLPHVSWLSDAKASSGESLVEQEDSKRICQTPRAPADKKESFLPPTFNQE